MAEKMLDSIIGYIFIAAIAVSLGLLPAYIAYRNGRSMPRWWIYGAVLFPAAIVHALMLGRMSMGRCPYCRGTVSMSVDYCKRCGYEFRSSE
ncbi:MAG: hypothetical protein AAB307_02575 [Deltaproteobacteria bacterium]